MYKSYSELGAQPIPNRDHYSVEELNDHQHKNQILSQNKLVVVDIYADWCGPCKQTAPEYSIIAQKYNKPGMCAIVKENLDKKMTANIQGVPTFHFFMNGRVIDEVVGADLPVVEKKLQEHLAKITGVQQGMNQGANNPIPHDSQGPAYMSNTIRQSGSPYHGHSFQSPQNVSGQPYTSQQSYHQPNQHSHSHNQGHGSSHNPYQPKVSFNQ